MTPLNPTTPLAPLRHHDTISLAGILELAALQTRVDRKYVVPAQQVAAVLASLDPSVRVLEIDGERSSAYESMYFDTPDLLSYRMAAQARRRRFKLRTRSYLDTGESWLELKTRGLRNTTVKERQPHPLEQRDQLTPAGLAYAAPVLNELGMPRADELRATLITRYRRTTLFAPLSESRATIDTELAWEAADGAGFTLPNAVIIETKSGSRPSDVDRALWRNGHRPVTISKYGTGLAALRPELGHSKWNRVLRRHFLGQTGEAPGRIRDTTAERDARSGSSPDRMAAAPSSPRRAA